MQELLTVFVFGLVIGSFLNVCIHRLPLEQEVVKTPSHCPRCQHGIAWYDNIPVVSWLILRGRCRHCREPISVQYPLVELLAGVVAVVTVHRFDLTPTAAALVVLGFAFLVMTVIDLYHYILPDVITLPGIVVGLVLSVLPWFGPPLADWQDALIGAGSGGGGLWLFAWLFFKITGREGMGFGDVKLIAMIGAWLGWQALPFTIFCAAALGSVVGITWILALGRDRHLPIPFGPYLTGAAWLYPFIGPDVYAWYFGLWRMGGV